VNLSGCKDLDQPSSSSVPFVDNLSTNETDTIRRCQQRKQIFLVRCFSRSGVLYGLFEVRKLEARVEFGEVQIIMAEQLLQVTNASAAKEKMACASPYCADNLVLQFAV
jgi:hypothetical protein